MTDHPSRIAEALADRYRIERELGAGGMATVYLAHDLRHDRKVALKVLRPELAAAIGPDRFLREITTTANLRHPHIVPLYDSGVADGFLYYVMPFVEGRSLRERLDRERQLPVDEALRITREVADALGQAHLSGVVHRDIKPENILLEHGHAVVTDFGIARAIGAAGGERLTRTGMAVGTPAYMSPEQSLGEGEIDGRSDLYALGSVLYEMLTGEPPYTGSSPQAITTKRLMQPVPSVKLLRESSPPAVDAALQRVLAKSPADRFATAAEFVAALSAPVPPRAGPATGSPGIRVSRRVAIAAVGVLVLVVVAAVAALRIGRGPSRSGGRPLVAVLPFRNAGATEQEFFADGVTEEITSRLGNVSGIGVISRTTASRYKGTRLSLRDIGRELGVQYILAGTIRADRRPDGTGEVRVTPELIRVSDELQVWTEGYTAGLTPGEVFRIQAQIAEQVAAACGVRLLAGDRQRIARQETVDPVAYDAYLQGRFQMNRRTGDGAREAVTRLRAAVARDSNYALAWAALAGAYAAIPFYPFDLLPGEDPWTEAEHAARRALRLDSTLSAAHVALAGVLGTGRWDWAAAESGFRRAIALDPDYAPARAGLSGLLTALGRYQEALDEADRAVALEPTGSDLRSARAEALSNMGRFDEAAAEERRALALEPSALFPHVGLAGIAAARGDIAAMARELAQTPSSAVAPALAAFAADPHRKPDLLRAIAAIQSPNAGLDATRKGWWYAVIGERDLALDSFEKAVALRAPPLVSALRFASVRQSLGPLPRYRAILTKVGLPPP